MEPNAIVAWRHVATHPKLVVIAAGQSDLVVVPVPESVTRWWIERSGVDTTADPAGDLIELERELRVLLAELLPEVTRAERRVSHARTAHAAAASPGWSRTARRAWRKSQVELSAAITAHTDLVDRYIELQALQAELRRFVIGLDIVSGPLGQAARGWRRSPDVPAGVSTYADENTFVQADPRRRDPGWDGLIIAGELISHGWRRDHDDDPGSRALDHVGPWSIGYIPRTRELYATRRGSYLPAQVWLLGTGLTADTVTMTLSVLDARRRAEPNSLILLAESMPRPLATPPLLSPLPPQRLSDSEDSEPDHRLGT